MTRKICVVTGTRAEYGLLRRMLHLIDSDPALQLQLVVTGTHLSPQHGLTIEEIEADGIDVADTVEILLSSDTPVGVSKAVGLGVIGLAESFARLAPDIVLLVGDRFEILAAATVALIHNIPIAHVHGGETTQGAIDESIRHAVTKFSQLHFVAVETYRDRVNQLGERPDRIFVVGGLGLDAIAHKPLLDKAELEESLDFNLGERHLLVTFHPPTAEHTNAEEQLDALLDVLDSIGTDIKLVFTMPNADAGGQVLRGKIHRYVSTRPHARAYESLGQLRYLSCLRYSSGIIGNSSSGVAEAPSLQIGTVNIGDRQAGRLRASSVIDCSPQRPAIAEAINLLLSRPFQDSLAEVINPNGPPGAADAIVNILRDYPIESLRGKQFYDIPLTVEHISAGQQHGV